MIQFAFTEYLETAPPDLAELAGAASTMDFANMRDCAHRLKGASNMIGASAAGALAYDLEKRSFAGDLNGYEDLPSEVARAIDEVLDFARDWLSDHDSETTETG